MQRAPRAVRTAAQTTALLVLVVLLSACQARLAIDVSVNAEGGGRLAVSLAADRALLDLAADAGADPLGDLAAAGRALEAQGWDTTEGVADDGGREVVLAVAFADPAEFNTLAAELAAALAAAEVEPLESLRLEFGEQVRLEGVAALEPTEAVTELGVQPEQAVRLVTERDAFRYDITAVLPGELLATTADGAEMPLRWTIAPGERVEILAVTDPPAARWWAVAAAAGALLLAAAAALWLVGARRRRSA